eukprot:Rmarinus@m.3889
MTLKRLLSDIEFQPLLSELGESEDGGNSGHLKNREDPFELFLIVDEEPTKSGSLLGATFTLANTALGAGTVALPWCIKQCGIILGAALLLGFACLNYFAISLLLLASVRFGAQGYEQLAEIAFGPAGLRVAQASKLLLATSAAIGYFCAIADLVPPMVHAFVGHSPPRTILVIILSFCPFLPMAMLPHISSLKYSSMLAVCSVLFMCAVVSTRGMAHAASHSFEHVALFRFERCVFSAVPIFFFAFGCHLSVFPVFLELPREKRTPKNMSAVTTGTMALISTLYVIVGFGGYFEWGERTEGNILLSPYPAHDIIIAICRLAMCVTLLCTLPLVTFACRQTLHSLLFPAHAMTATYRVVETISIVAVISCVTIVAPDITTVFGLAGATCGVMVFYVLPCILYIQLMPYIPGWKWEARRTFAWITMLLAIALGILGIIEIIQNDPDNL